MNIHIILDSCISDGCIKLDIPVPRSSMFWTTILKHFEDLPALYKFKRNNKKASRNYIGSIFLIRQQKKLSSDNLNSSVVKSCT